MTTDQVSDSKRYKFLQDKAELLERETYQEVEDYNEDDSDS